jgi:hypothetical protein
MADLPSNLPPFPPDPSAPPPPAPESSPTATPRHWHPLGVIFGVLLMLLVASTFVYHGANTSWLFITDLFHQILFYFGGVAAMGLLLWEKFSEKPVPWRWISPILLGCLFVSCYQAWLDEHRNSEQLIEEKLNISRQLGFWEGQSFAKDDAIRVRDQLLLQGLQTLGSTQQTENQTQQSLTSLSGKILDLTKPQPLEIYTKVMDIDKTSNPQVKAVVVVAETTARIGSFTGKIVCANPFGLQQVSLLQGMMSQSPAYHQVQGQTEIILNFSGSAWDTHQPLVAIIFGGTDLDSSKCRVTQQ